MKTEITIMEELKRLLPPLEDNELALLDESIVADGKPRERLRVWNEPFLGHVLIDGHNRWKICQARDIPFEVDVMEFPDIQHVKRWMIRNQLGRRNLSASRRADLATEYLKGLDKPASIAELADAADVSTSTISRARKRARERLSSPADAPVIESLSEPEPVPYDDPQPEPLKPIDVYGQPIPDDLTGVFGPHYDTLRTILISLRTSKATVRKMQSQPGGERLAGVMAEQRLQEVIDCLEPAIPYCVCPICKGIGKRVDVQTEPPCLPCEGYGWIPESQLERFPATIRKALVGVASQVHVQLRPTNTIDQNDETV